MVGTAVMMRLFAWKREHCKWACHSRRRGNRFAWVTRGRTGWSDWGSRTQCMQIVFMQMVFEYLFITEKAEPCSVWKYFAKLCDCCLRLLKSGTAKAHWNSLNFIESRFDPGLGAPENARLLVDRDPLLTLTSYYANLNEFLPTNKGGFC